MAALVETSPEEGPRTGSHPELFDLVPALDPNGGKGNHKGHTGRPLDPEEVTALVEGQGIRPTADMGYYGGLLYLEGRRWPIGYFLPPEYRFSEGRYSIGQLTTDHIRPLSTVALTAACDPRFSAVTMGSELEVLTWDPRVNDLAHPMSEDSPVGETVRPENMAAIAEEHLGDPSASKDFDTSQETTDTGLELNLPAGSDPADLALRMLRNLQLLQLALGKHGISSLPIAVLPNKKLQKEWVNTDPYIQHMNFNIIGWEMAQHFVGNSFQTLFRTIHPESGQYALNKLQDIEDLFYALSLGGPFNQGKLSGGLSGRYESRLKGSPSGGIFRDPLPETYAEYNRRAYELLHDGIIPSHARVGGQHRDRLRMDIADGLAEMCGLDNAAGDPVRMIALLYGSAIAFWKLDYLKYTNQTDKLEKWSTLFHNTTSRSSLVIADENNRSVAEHGTAGETTGADGKKYATEERFAKFLDFISEPIPEAEYYGISKNFRQTLERMGAPKISDATIRRYTILGKGFLDLSGIYEITEATPAHWMKLRYEQLTRAGMDHNAAITNCMGNLAAANAKNLFDPRTAIRLQNLFR